MFESIIDYLADWYLALKAFHLISVISWMAGLLYLPRLFVYHCDAKPGSQENETFKLMERRLMKVIMLPAMLFSFVFGILLILVPGVLERPSGWFHVKILAVFCMTGVHGAMGRWRKDFFFDRNKKSPRFFRLINEVPTLLMILIIFMVVLKPF